MRAIVPRIMLAERHNFVVFERKYSRSVYSADSIKSALYKFNAFVSAKIDVNQDDYVCVFAALKNDFNWENFCNEFDQELIDQELREKLAHSASDYRNVILGLAFSKTGFQSNE